MKNLRRNKERINADAEDPKTKDPNNVKSAILKN